MSGHLSYGLQEKLALIGTPAVPLALTTLYTGRTATFITSGVAMVMFYIQYTAQTIGNSIQIKIEGSPITTNDGTPTFYQEASSSVAAGVADELITEHNHTSTTATAERFRISFPCADQTVKISIKETVAAGTAGTACVEALKGSND